MEGNGDDEIDVGAGLAEAQRAVVAQPLRQRPGERLAEVGAAAELQAWTTATRGSSKLHGVSRRR